MGHSSNQNNKNKTIEIKQNFFASAIVGITTWIQLIDTKVSILMGALVAIIVGIVACYEPIWKVVKLILPCRWKYVLLIIFTVAGVISTIVVFVFGLMTLRGHTCIINYKSKWYLPKSTKEYSFDEYSKDVQRMNDNDIIINMAAELYKLNDMHRQKAKTMKWALYAFSIFLIIIFCVSILFLVSL